MWGSDKWGYEPKAPVLLEDFVVWMEKGYDFKLKNGTRMKRRPGNFIADTENWLSINQNKLSHRIIDQKISSFLSRSDISIASNISSSGSGKSYDGDDDYEE
jgi:hypothetical protein